MNLQTADQMRVCAFQGICISVDNNKFFLLFLKKNNYIPPIPKCVTFKGGWAQLIIK